MASSPAGFVNIGAVASVWRRRAIIAVGAAVFTGSLFPIDRPHEAAPKFTAKTLDGEKLTNESLKGKVVLLQFWATWCRFCRQDQPAVDALVRELSAKGLVVVAVNAGESRGKVKQYLQESPRACKIVLAEDTNLLAKFAVTITPSYVVIDKDGNIAGIQGGAGVGEGLRQLLRKAGLAGE